MKIISGLQELEILVHSSFVYHVVTLGVMRVYFRNVQLPLIFLKNNEPNSPHEMSLSPAGNYIFKVNNRSTRTRCNMLSKLTIKTPERRHWRRSRVFIVNFKHISYLVLVFLLLTLSR